MGHPGFGDSARLVQRLRQRGNPVGWFLTGSGTAGAIALSGQPAGYAMCGKRSRCGAVSGQCQRAPGDAGYVALEMEILALAGAEAGLVLLNQLERTRPGDRTEPTRKPGNWPAIGFARRISFRWMMPSRPLLGAGIHPARCRGRCPAENRLAPSPTEGLAGTLGAVPRPPWRCWASSSPPPAAIMNPLSDEGAGGTLRRLGQLVGMDENFPMSGSRPWPAWQSASDGRVGGPPTN